MHRFDSESRRTLTGSLFRWCVVVTYFYLVANFHRIFFLMVHGILKRFKFPIWFPHIDLYRHKYQGCDCVFILPWIQPQDSFLVCLIFFAFRFDFLVELDECECPVYMHRFYEWLLRILVYMCLLRLSWYPFIECLPAPLIPLHQCGLWVPLFRLALCRSRADASWGLNTSAEGANANQGRCLLSSVDQVGRGRCNGRFLLTLLISLLSLHPFIPSSIPSSPSIYRPLTAHQFILPPTWLLLCLYMYNVCAYMYTCIHVYVCLLIWIWICITS